MTSLAHAVSGKPLCDTAGDLPISSNESKILFGMGCFWGAERRFWQHPSVSLTAVGYAGGQHDSPNYEQVCSGMTGHTEVVAVVFPNNDEKILLSLLQLFWESHDPTQGMRQGNDMGSQYRSAIYCFSDYELEIVQRSKKVVEEKLKLAGFPSVTTEIAKDKAFHFAEEYHQQYLVKNPNGYCGLRGTGVEIAEALSSLN